MEDTEEMTDRHTKIWDKMNYAHSDEEYLVLQTRNSVHLLFIAQGEGLNLSL